MLDLDGTIEATELPGGRFVVSAHGPLDARVAAALRDALVPLAYAEGSLVLDLDDAHGLDDDALAVVAQAAHLVRRRGERMGIVTRRTALLDIVRDCGLLDIVTIHRTLRDALAVD
jgi:anti-anti-sigma factor